MDCCSNLSHDLTILKYDGTVSSITNAAICTDIFETDNIGMLEQNNDNHLMTKFAIQIMDHHHLSSYEINAAIIMYNYGIAFHYIANSCQSLTSNDLRDPMNNSRSVLLLSYNVLQQLSSIDDEDDHDDNDDRDDNDEHLILLLLSCLVTMELFHNAMESDTPDEAFLYY